MDSCSTLLGTMAPCNVKWLGEGLLIGNGHAQNVADSAYCSYCYYYYLYDYCHYYYDYIITIIGSIITMLLQSADLYVLQE